MRNGLIIRNNKSEFIESFKSLFNIKYLKKINFTFYQIFVNLI